MSLGYPSLAMPRPLMATNSQTAAALSTSASVISPLNPLPSPWGVPNDTGNQLSPSTSYSSDMSSGLGSVGSAAGALGSGGGAMRLNRVPTSVRLASDLIRSSTPLSSSTTHGHAHQHSSSSSSGSQPVAASHPHTPGHRRELSSFSSLPSPPRSTQPGDGPTRPTLSVPATPSATRNVTPEDLPDPPVTAKDSASLAMPPPPSSLKPPSQIAQPQPKSRPSLPAPAAFNAGVLGEPFTGVSKHSKFRTSVHEATFTPTESSNSPPPWTPHEAGGDSAPSSISVAKRRPPFGLGLEMPSSSHPAAEPGSLTTTSTRKRVFESDRDKGFALDLAGLGTMGDASQHATMIMQSRQAKMQRWRPGSAGVSGMLGMDSGADRRKNRDQLGDEDQQGPPRFNRSTTFGAPALLAARRASRKADWDFQEPSATSASSPTDIVPPKLTSDRLDRVGTLPTDGFIREGDIADARTRFPGQSDSSKLSAFGTGVPMSKEVSATGSVNGIEWVDWLDEYKMYKEAKIRAEQAEAESVRLAHQERQARSGSSQDYGLPAVPDEDGGDVGDRRLREESPKNESLGSCPAATERFRDYSNAVSLTPTTSREDMTAYSGAPRRRSLSIRSTLSAFDPKFSPTQRRASIFEKPRQASISSLRSSDNVSVTGNGKKKKNLVSKMEGWWNAVKSNFTPESGNVPVRPAGQGMLQPRIPSAPQSRRGSSLNPATSHASPTELLHPGLVRRESTSGQPLRNATSHAELRYRNTFDEPGFQPAASVPSSASADLSVLSVSHSPDNYLLRDHTARRSVSSVLSTISSFSTQQERPASGLEARRKQPHLSLKLEPHVLGLNTRSSSRGTASTSSIGRHGSDGQSGSDHRPKPVALSHGTSRSSSYGHSLNGPGLTPGVHRWDITPSPVYSFQPGSRTSPEDLKMAVPSTDFTTNSVRRHIKHRLASAKDTCDKELRKIVNAIASFVEEQIRLDQVETLEGDEETANAQLAALALPCQESDADEDAVDLSEDRNIRRGMFHSPRVLAYILQAHRFPFRGPEHRAGATRLVNRVVRQRAL